MTTAPRRDIIAIGGSAGSGAVLRSMVADLPADFAASIFITTHMPTHGGSLLADMLSARTSLPVSQVVDGQPIVPGHIHVAVPDRHLLLIGDTIRLGPGPRENMARPAIDAMFRSAALSFGSRVVGVVLSGMLNDGASGIAAIKARGGTGIVQHPLDAEADAMPLAALETAAIDHIAGTSGLARTIVAVAATDAAPDAPITDALRLEVAIAAGERLGSARLRTIAQATTLTCPDCHGVLSEVRGSQPLRYRCQIGHGYTADVLVARTDEVDEAITIAMRIMEERVTLVERMAQDARATGRGAVAELYDGRAEEYRRYANTLRAAAIASPALSAGTRKP